ncbi:hypothetical protein [Streptomyces sp. NBC_01443]|uniref:hypothetical protein n=1 Tax=Streptomyces sp. NBC_01443 TaxID=2903868 RepID=UPI0022533648|nr:hypothetical protein [Streptomyces sp. NBC_01443]MCX4626045.1 hypothetical protein [Streptomyces sp. NBC_01443]
MRRIQPPAGQVAGMVSSMDVTDFANQLPRVDSRAFPVKDSTRGLEFLSDVRPDFVSPRLAEPADSDAGAAAVLIAAPAAAGKTTCAQAVAALSGAPLVNLAGQRVGATDFQGILAEALGMASAGRFLELLERNEASIVLDALDETSLLSGEHNFQSFIQGICRALRRSSGVGNVVMLSRLDTADWVIDEFEEEGVALRRLSLEYFSQSEAEKYIDLKLDQLYKGRQPAHQVNSRPYHDVRDKVLARIANGLGAEGEDYWSNESTKRFLGYSPVLDTVASYLCVANHHELAVKISHDAASSFGSVPEWKILKTLTEDLLVREKDKFLNGWPYEEKVSREVFDGHALAYTPLEQCVRLLSLVETHTSDVDLPAHLPSELSESYRDRVGSQLREHPFITTDKKYVNGIFRDYLYALALSDQIVDEVGLRVIDHLRGVDSLPSPALAPFIAELVNSAPANTFPANRCDLLIASLAARRDGSLNYEFSIDADAQGGDLEVRRGTPGRAFEIARVPLYVAGRSLRLPSRCQSLSVDYAGNVEIIAPTQVVKLGPSVSIRSELLSIEAGSLYVESTEDGPVSIDSGIVTSDYSLHVRTFGSGAFSVFGEEIEGSLRDHQAPRAPGKVALGEYFYALRRILMRFRSTVHMGDTGYLSASRTQLDRYVIHGDRKAVRIMDCLIELGALSTVDESFVLDIDVLGRAGINHVAVRNFRETPEIISFLENQVLADSTA